MLRQGAAYPGRSARRPLRVASVAVVLAVISAGLATGTPWRQGTNELPLGQIAAACDTDNPFVGMVCLASVMVFQDTPSDQPHYLLGRRLGSPRGGQERESDIGAIWGLAQSSTDQAIYVAATHRRSVAFGPGGPGAVYRIDLATGDIALPIIVPDAGSDHHLPDARSFDVSARYWAGKTSLGDLDLSEDESELFVTNLDNRRIYRFSVPDGRLIGSFPNGGTGEDWSESARPWALAVRANTLYHGVVHSSEFDLRRSQLRAVVYASEFDGSAMRQVYSTGLDYVRGTLPLVSGVPRTEWFPWQSISLQKLVNVHPMPILADIGFAADGSLLLGMKDRLGDMVAPGSTVEVRTGSNLRPSPIESGITLGDILFAPKSGESWLPPEHDRFNPGSRIRTDWPQGGFAMLGVTDTLVAGATEYELSRSQVILGEQSAFWYPTGAQDPTRRELACLDSTQPQPLVARGGKVLAAPNRSPLQDNGEPVYINVIPPVPGDVELLCAPTVHPTPSPSPTPLISPTPSATRTPSPTPTATPVPTDTATPSPTTTPSPTRVPGPVYLPIALSEPPCLPVKPTLDVILILDASTSMADPTRAGRPKIDAAVAAARDFVTRLALAPDGDHAALVAFNVDATLLAPLTDDRPALDTALDGIALAQFTRIDLGLEAAAAELASGRRRPGAIAAVILLTDGRSNPVPVSEAERAAEAVKATGARLFTIGLGQDLDADALRRMASRPADYFEAPDGEDLAAIYQAISAALPCPPYAHWPEGPHDLGQSARRAPVMRAAPARPPR